MKTLQKIQTIVAAIIVVISFQNCSKDRIETETTSYESMNEYFDSKKQEEQEYIIDTLGECPLTGKLGTRICINKSDLQFTNGDSIYYPYTLKLVELYSIKDMIYYQATNNTSDGYYTSKGEVRIRTFKNDTELQLRQNKAIEVEIKDSLANQDMSVYYQQATDPFTWSKSTDIYSATEYGYLGLVSLGWNAAGKQASYTNQAIVSFTSETDNLETVEMYMYVSSAQSIVRINNHKQIETPIGEQVTFICMAIDKQNQLYSYTTNKTITGDTTIVVTLTKISDNDLTQILDNL
ncbi:MAG: hypothetical protein BWY22_00002 [Bacteroidetes bacterium ADurb.Bin217]|nr:MAG: hypothetical protein BWY22_00002 [Bacteroidetes bacterium ADurb.Bin217]